MTFEYAVVSLDTYCPSMKNKLEKGIRKKYNIYWPGNTAIKHHYRCHAKPVSPSLKELEKLHVDSYSEFEEQNTNKAHRNIPVFNNIFDIAKPPFVENKNGVL